MKLRWLSIFLSFSIIIGLSIVDRAEGSLEDEAKHSASKQNFDPVVRFGNPDTALIKVVMYHSLNCIHCKEYLEKDFPAIKAKYIDTGKIYFEIRDYPIDRSALDAARLAWCRQDPQVYWQVAKLLHNQLDEDDPTKSWAQSADWCDEITKILTEKDFTQEECQNCLSNEALEKKIVNDCYKVQQKYKLSYTPAFIVDEELIGNKLDTQDIEKLLKDKPVHNG